MIAYTGFLVNPDFWVAIGMAVAFGALIILLIVMLAIRSGLFGLGRVTYGKEMVIEGQRVRLPGGETGRIYFANFGTDGSYRLGLYDVANPKTGLRTNNAFLVGAGNQHIFLPVVSDEPTIGGNGGAFDMAKELLDLRAQTQKLRAQNQQLVDLLKPRGRGRPSKAEKAKEKTIQDIMGIPEPGEPEDEGIGLGAGMGGEAG